MKFIPILGIIVLCCLAGIAHGDDAPKISCNDCHSKYMTDIAISSSATIDDCKDCHQTGSKIEWKTGSCSDRAEEEKYDGVTLTMFTEDDSEWASETMSNSGFGKIIALINWFYQVSPVIALILLLIAAVLSKLASKVDTGKWAITGMFYIVAALFALKIVLVVVSAVKPDLSVIAI